MIPILAFLVIFLIYAVGDIVANKTKAILSSLVVASVIYLVGFWVGLPKTIFGDSAMLAIGGVCIAILLTHMGTTMSLIDLVRQWKTVVIGAGAVVAIGVFCFLIAGPIIGREYAITGAPVLSGAVVATLIMSEAANNAGLPELAVYATMVMVLQGFFGYPVASICLKSEGRRVLKLFRGGGELQGANEEQVAVPKKRLIPPLPESYQTSNIIMVKLAIVAFIAYELSQLTNGTVNQLVICLVLGVIFKEIGFLEENALVKANSFGLIIACTTLAVFSNLVNATPAMLKEQALPLIVLIVVGIFGLSVVSIIVGKIVGYSWQMSLAIGSSALFGFPGTYILSNEVATALAETPEEKKAILDAILPKMLVAGMVTVSISSVVLAGFMSKML